MYRLSGHFQNVTLILVSAAVALIGMLVVMFSFEGQVILERPLDVVRITIYTGRKRRDKEKIVMVLSLTK